MIDRQHKDINSVEQIALKKCWTVGNNTVVVIDKTIVQRLGINEDNTLFEEELTSDGGILLRIKRVR